MENDPDYWYGLFRFSSWAFAAGFTIINLCIWTAESGTASYHYRRGKNGWWLLFWLVILTILTNWEW